MAEGWELQPAPPLHLLLLQAPKDSNFYNSVTLSLGGRPYQIVFW